METLREYIEKKEAEEMLNEGLMDMLGKLLGIGTAGVMTAWLTALLFKGGKKAINSIMNTARSFKRNNTEIEEPKRTSAVKEQEIKIDERKKEFEEELSDVYTAISNKDWTSANEAFHSLPKVRQDSTEIKKAVIEAIVKEEGPIITAEPTPGSKTFQGIRKTIDLPTAKAMAAAFKKNLENIGVISKID